MMRKIILLSVDELAQKIYKNMIVQGIVSKSDENNSESQEEK